MRDFLADSYLWLKAGHIIFVVCWMAALFYLPRLFVYHVAAKKGGELSETLKIMEYRLNRFIMLPAMILTFFFGILLAFIPGILTPSLHLKFLIVLILGGYHGFLVKCLKAFQKDKNTHSEKFFRVINEIPSFLLIIIVVLVVVKPI